MISQTAFSILSANVDAYAKDTVKNWKIENSNYGPMGEDLCVEMCMRKNEVTGTEVFDIINDGCCQVKRPGNEEENQKWKPDCGSTNTLAIHPFKKRAAYKQRMEPAEKVTQSKNSPAPL